MPGLFLLVMGLESPSATARTVHIDTHAQLVKRLMQRHRAGTRYRFGTRLRVAADLDADWIVIKNTVLLRQLTWLTSASLSRATLPGFGFLKRWKNLQRLDLSKTRIRSLKPLAGLTRLRELDISGSRVRDVRPLAKAANLMELRLGDTRITDLRPLQHMALSRLELGSTTMARLPRLGTLAVDRLVITDAKANLDFRSLATAQITRLVLDSTGVTQLRGLAKHPTLRVISLTRTRVALQAIRKLCKANQALQVITPKGRTVGRTIHWMRARPKLSNYPCLTGTGACSRETFGWERRKVIRWVSP